ncbi:MAG: hypothetical protein RIM84_16645 [Alphaproteobacteria bacterium]
MDSLPQRLPHAFAGDHRATNDDRLRYGRIRHPGQAQRDPG